MSSAQGAGQSRTVCSNVAVQGRPRLLPAASDAVQAGAWACRSLSCIRRLACPLLQEDGVADYSGVAAVLCGQKDMAVAVTELLGGKGVPRERVLTNF